MHTGPLVVTFGLNAAKLYPICNAFRVAMVFLHFRQMLKEISLGRFMLRNVNNAAHLFSIHSCLSMCWKLCSLVFKVPVTITVLHSKLLKPDFC